MRLALCLSLLAAIAHAQLLNPDGGPVEPGTLPDRWATGGPNCAELPDWEVHAYNPDLYILRESGCTNYEKPFLYLLFGHDRVLLIDTGAGPAKTAEAVSKVIAARKLQAKLTVDPKLVVTHSHGHGDHTAGDAQFRDQPGIEFIAPTTETLAAALHIATWPDSTGTIDLGNRIIDVVPIPGHQVAAVAYYDRRTGLLFTGDSLYPGRLYVTDWPAFAASTERLIHFTDGKPVTHILGCHIEQARRPYLDYPVGTAYQPDEHALALGRAELLELNDALHHLGPTPARAAYRDFTVWPRQPKPAR